MNDFKGFLINTQTAVKMYKHLLNNPYCNNSNKSIAKRLIKKYSKEPNKLLFGNVIEKSIMDNLNNKSLTLNDGTHYYGGNIHDYIHNLSYESIVPYSKIKHFIHSYYSKRFAKSNQNNQKYIKIIKDVIKRYKSNPNSANRKIANRININEFEHIKGFGKDYKNSSTYSSFRKWKKALYKDYEKNLTSNYYLPNIESDFNIDKHFYITSLLDRLLVTSNVLLPHSRNLDYGILNKLNMSCINARGLLPFIKYHKNYLSIKEGIFKNVPLNVCEAIYIYTTCLHFNEIDHFVKLTNAPLLGYDFDNLKELIKKPFGFLAKGFNQNYIKYVKKAYDYELLQKMSLIK